MAKKAITSKSAKPPNDPPTAAPIETLLESNWAPAPAVVVVLESVEDGLGGIVMTDVIPAEDDDEEEGITRK